MFMSSISFIRPKKKKKKRKRTFFLLTGQDCLTRSCRLYSSILSLLHYEKHQIQRGTQVAEVDVAEQRKDRL